MSAHRDYEDIFLSSVKEVNDFQQKIQDDNLMLEKQPYFVSAKHNNEYHYFDIHIRLYTRINHEHGIRVSYKPKFEWDPFQVKRRF